MIWAQNPVAFSILSLDIRWYGIVYALGFIFAEWYGWQRIKDSNKVTHKQWETVALGAFFFGVLGGRLGEFIFFSPEILFNNPTEIFKIWHGGMSIQGGLIGAVIWIWHWCNKHKVSPLLLTDALALPLAIVLIFGRWANWMNGELWGRPTGTDWGVIFPHVDDLLRHPSQLYEVAKNTLLATIIFLVEKKQSRTLGLSTIILISGYGILRFIIEFYRESEIIFIGLTTGQLLSLAMLAGAGVLVYKLNIWRK